jgi:hypothetical protein
MDKGAWQAPRPNPNFNRGRQAGADAAHKAPAFDVSTTIKLVPPPPPPVASLSEAGAAAAFGCVSLWRTSPAWDPLLAQISLALSKRKLRSPQEQLHLCTNTATGRQL